MRYLTVILMGALLTLAGCGGDKSGGQTPASAASAEGESPVSEAMSAEDGAPVDTPQWMMLEQNVIYYDE